MTEEELKRITTPAKAEYDRIIAEAKANRNRVVDKAKANRDRIDVVARAEYRRITAPAWAEYNRITTPAWAEYRRIEAEAEAEYPRVRAEAEDEYQRVIAEAYAKPGGQPIANEEQRSMYKKVESVAIENFRSAVINHPGSGIAAQRFRKQAQAEYDQAIAQALAEYKRVTGEDYKP